MPYDDASDRTEPPTPRRREEAREEGQIARSVDLTAAIVLLAALVLLKTLGPRMLESLLGLTRALGAAPDITSGGLLAWIKHVASTGGMLLLPFLGLVVLVAIVASAAQTGLMLTWKKLGFKPERLNPVSGFRRLLSADAIRRLALGLLKVAIVAAVAWLTIRSRIGLVMTTGKLEAGGVFQVSAELLFDLAIRLGLVLLLLGLVDYLLDRWKLERQLRMTRQEIRDELKRMEGDPLIRQRRRQLQTRLALQRIHAEVPKSDVVVTNPTHYAVALRYDQATMAAPRVVAKGQDLLAERIRQLALQYGVPIVQRPALARALYVGVEVGQEIPPMFYRAVAEVLAYVYQLSGKMAG